MITIVTLPFAWLVFAKLSATSRHFGVSVFSDGYAEYNLAIKQTYPRDTRSEVVQKEIERLGFSCENRFSKDKRLFCLCHQNLLVAHRSWFIDIQKRPDGTVEDISGTSRTSTRRLRPGSPKCKPYYGFF